MNKTEYWRAVTEKYPDLVDDEHVVKLRSRGLRRLIDQAWDEGRASVPKPPKNDILSELFGKFTP